MEDYVKKLLPRFRYGVIQPRAHEDVQRARSYQLYLLPLDFMEISTGRARELYGGRRRESGQELLDLCRPAGQRKGRSYYFQRRADLRHVDPPQGARIAARNETENRNSTLNLRFQN